jgi:hypothetical protein
MLYGLPRKNPETDKTLFLVVVLVAALLIAAF